MWPCQPPVLTPGRHCTPLSFSAHSEIREPVRASTHGPWSLSLSFGRSNSSAAPAVLERGGSSLEPRRHHTVSLSSLPATCDTIKKRAKKIGKTFGGFFVIISRIFLRPKNECFPGRSGEAGLQPSPVAPSPPTLQTSHIRSAQMIFRGFLFLFVFSCHSTLHERFI